MYNVPRKDFKYHQREVRVHWKVPFIFLEWCLALGKQFTKGLSFYYNIFFFPYELKPIFPRGWVKVTTINGIIKKVLFYVWFLCVGIVVLKFNRVVFYILVSSLYFWIVFHYIDILQFVYWLSHRWALWFVSSLGFLWLWLFLYQGGHKCLFLFRYILKLGSLGHIVGFCLLKTVPVFQGGCMTLQSQ